MLAGLATLATAAFVLLFRCWQWTFSAVLPPSCRFSPSCSHYGIEALRRHGLLKGLWLTAGRILRCHPWGGSGHDPVPEEFHPFSGRAAPEQAKARDE